MSWTIKPANSSCIERCSDILVQSRVGKTYFPNKQNIQGRIGESLDSDEIFVAINKDNEIDGFVWFQMRGAFSFFPFLYMIATDPNQHRKGLARKMMDYYEQYVLYKQVPKRLSTKSFLLVAEFNTAAQSLYRNLGYIEVARLQALYRKRIDEILMMKDIRKSDYAKSQFSDRH